MWRVKDRSGGHLTWSCHSPGWSPSCQTPAPEASRSLFGWSVKKRMSRTLFYMPNNANNHICSTCHSHGIVSFDISSSSYQVQNDLSSIENDLRVKVSLESIQLQRETLKLRWRRLQIHRGPCVVCNVKRAYVVHCFADLWFWLVLEIGPLGPVEGDGASGLWGKST